MRSETNRLWTIEELAAEVALVLAEGEFGTLDGRIREVPDARTIRYYTTLGLLDRPAQMRGRTALYGTKHLLQLVAIKRLQAQGHTLVAIQQQLLGKDEAELEAIAQLPAQPREPTRRQFWRGGLPSPGQAVGGRQRTGLVPVQLQEAQAAPAAPRMAQPPAAVPLQGVPLRQGVTLLVAAARAITPEDMQMLEAAAEPLLKCLEKRRLIEPLS
jgi:DNA-binding transcriptional MerR regulator